MLGDTQQSSPQSPKDPVVGRLAPSPTGALHLGNARSFLLAWMFAAVAGSSTHRTYTCRGSSRAPWSRFRGPEMARNGLGRRAPKHGRLEGSNYVQSAGVYEEALQELIKDERVYPCICSRKTLPCNSPPSRPRATVPGTCRERWRTLIMPRHTSPSASLAGGLRSFLDAQSFEDQHCGLQNSSLSSGRDFVVAQGFNKVGYQLAVCIDDHRKASPMFYVATIFSRALTDNWPSTNTWAGHPKFWALATDTGRRRQALSKRHGDGKSQPCVESVVRPRESVALSPTLGWTV